MSRCYSIISRTWCMFLLTCLYLYLTRMYLVTCCQNSAQVVVDGLIWSVVTFGYLRRHIKCFLVSAFKSLVSAWSMGSCSALIPGHFCCDLVSGHMVPVGLSCACSYSRWDASQVIGCTDQWSGLMLHLDFIFHTKRATLINSHMKHEVDWYTGYLVELSTNSSLNIIHWTPCHIYQVGDKLSQCLFWYF